MNEMSVTATGSFSTTIAMTASGQVNVMRAWTSGYPRV
jgi:hypothetical protein